MPTNSGDEIACRMVFGIADNRRTAAVRAHGLSLRNRGDRVIGTFAVDVRFETSKQLVDIRVGENQDIVDRSEGTDDRGSIGSSKNRPVRPLQRADRVIVIDRHDEPIGLCLRTFQIANVTDVQHVEATIGKGDGSAGGAIGLQKHL